MEKRKRKRIDAWCVVKLCVQIDKVAFWNVKY